MMRYMLDTNIVSHLLDDGLRFAQVRLRHAQG